MKTHVDRAAERGELRRPTDFLPNGCGPAAFGPIDPVPDELVGVNFESCCDQHDLEYHRGGFLGLFWRKPKSDFGLARCMYRRFQSAAAADKGAGRKGKSILKRALAPVAASVYFGAVTLLGWTPFTWSWSERPTPDAEALEDLKAKRELKRCADC